MTITAALEDANLFKPWFDDESWDAWKVVLKSTFSLPLTAKELQLFTQFTNRKTVPSTVNELWLLVGRRGGKSMIAALIATYLAFFLDWKKVLSPGERGVGRPARPVRGECDLLVRSGGRPGDLRGRGWRQQLPFPPLRAASPRAGLLLARGGLRRLERVADARLLAPASRARSESA